MQRRMRENISSSYRGWRKWRKAKESENGGVMKIINGEKWRNDGGINGGSNA
jgi:hypothetical protein